MKIEGRLIKAGRYWAVEIPLLLINTQGRNRKDALEMAEDAVETIVEKSGFKATATSVSEDRFVVGANDQQSLFAVILKQQRAAMQLSIREVANRLGSKSPTAYSQYESGKVSLSLDKFTQILEAINGDVEPVMTLMRKHA